MPTIRLGEYHLPNLALGSLGGSSTSARTGLVRLTLYISILCTWSLVLLMKGVAYRWGSGFLRRYNQPLSDVEAANNITNTQNADSHQQTPSTRHTPLGSARSRVLEQSEKLRVGWETLSRTGGNMASAVFLLVRLVNEPCDRFFMAAVAAYAQKQITWREKSLICGPKDFVSIDLPLDVVNMHFEKFDYVALDVFWPTTQPGICTKDLKDNQSSSNIHLDQKPSGCKYFIASAKSCNKSLNKPTAVLLNKTSLDSTLMGAVESLPSATSHRETSIFGYHTTASSADCNKDVKVTLSSGEKPTLLRRSGTRSLLRASIRRYTHMAPGWARNSGSKGTNSGDHVSALKLAPVSPKRMPSAEDVGAITRAAELRGRGPGGLNFGSAESDVGAHAIVTQLSASMPHLPSRIGMPTASSNSFNELHATTGTPSSTPVATDLSQISAESGSAAASSLLLFPIDFVSATSDSAEQHRQSAGVSANSLTKPRRGSGIFEIRQRLARRLTRNGRQARRHVSSGGGSSPVATAQTITTNASTSFSASMMEASFGSSHSGGSWVRQRKRMFTGNRPGSLATDSQSVDGDTLMRETPCLPMEGSDAADGAQHHALADSTGATDDVADELACGLEKLAISRGGSHSGTMDFDDDVATAECQDSNLPSSRLLSESIDCLLEKRLSSSFDNNPAYGESPTSNNSNLLNDPATTTAKTSTTGSLVSSSASSATLSDPGSQSLTETIEGSESDCAPHATQSGSCKNGLDCSSVNGTNKGIANALGFSSHVLSLGGLQSDLLSTSPDTRGKGDENSVPLGSSGDCQSSVRKWWPRFIVPVQNMQYMPKMSVLFFEASQRQSGGGGGGGGGDSFEQSSRGLCNDCMSTNQFVDEAMALGSTTLLECRNSECRNYTLHSNSSNSSVTLRDWCVSKTQLSFGGDSFKDCKRGRSSDSNSSSSGKSGNKSSLDYWDVLSRCPMRPTSSLALSSLKAMARSVTSSSSFLGESKRGGSSGTRARRRVPNSSESDSDSSDTDMQYSDDDSEEKNESAVEDYLSLGPSSAKVSQQGRMQEGGKGQRGKQKPKRVLSEPMQYILYNSYMRYYGRPSSL